MAVTININDISLVHLDSGGIAIATLPDVCNTPGAGPLPYPNIARSSDLKKGTRTVKVDGGNPAAIYGSEFYKSTGDEPGTGGGVKSGVNMDRATWITYSFNVKFEGKGACRLTDKMFMNDGNTVCLAGVINPPVFKPPTDPKCSKIYEKIFEIIWSIRPETPVGGRPQGYQGLAQRWKEFAENVGGRGTKPDGTLSKFLKGHFDEYKKHQDRLKKSIDDWDKNNCDNMGGDGLKPLKAREYANNTPELGPGKPIEPASEPSLYPTVAKVAAGAGIAVVAIIVITRLIRCIPPLLPLQLSPV